MRRPSKALLESAYDHLFRSSLDKLIDSALHGRLFHDVDDGMDGVAGRSIAWKLFLAPHLPLTSSLNPRPVPPIDYLCQSREHYITLLKEKMRAPDGSYEEGFKVPHSSVAPIIPSNWNLNNPLSLDSSNPWHTYFSALELRNTIRQDVERAFPEIAYFRSIDVQNEITDILFIHASERVCVGYRQGMHELLACIYRAVDFDSIGPDVSVDPQLQQLCDRTYVAADAYTLFGAIMQRMEVWYEWRAAVSDPVSPLPQDDSSTFTVKSQANVLVNGQLKPYVAPIVRTCASLRDEKLRAVDPHLWEKLREGGIETQMYGMRWLRLLFTREFTPAESMIIWDGLFASVASDAASPSSSLPSYQGFELALWISVAMLIRIRNILIAGDFNTQLTYLLRYPNPSSIGASQTYNAPELLLSQAQQLSISPSPGTGVSLMIQNRNELGIPVELLEPPSSSPHERRASAPTSSAPSTDFPGKSGQMLEKTRLQDIIASRLMDANQTLGLQRSFFNTISEIRKNLPDLSHSLSRPRNDSSISLDDEHTDESARKPIFAASDVVIRPPWEPKFRSEIESEMSELRILLKTLGGAVDWAVDVLLNEEEAKEAQQGEKTLRQKKTEAVECLVHVRDILLRGGEGEIDKGRLIGKEERKRQQQANEGKSEATMDDTHSPPTAPAVSSLSNTLAESSPDSPTYPWERLSTKEATLPISSLTRTSLHPGLTSSTPPSVLCSTKVNHIPHVGAKPIASTESETQKAFPPLKHPSIDPGGAAPYASRQLPQYPPRQPSDNSKSSASVRSSTEASMSSTRADPLGVLR